MNETPFIIGPFTQLLTMDHLPPQGPIADEDLKIFKGSALAIQGKRIIEIGPFEKLKTRYPRCHGLDFPAVALPGWIDSHTHLCFAGSRSSDYAQRLSGKSYQEIAASGGGILDTVKRTRNATKTELLQLTLQRAKRQLQLGITTCEVKSGYGLSVEEEIKILEVIRDASAQQPVELIPTCLAAHLKAPEFSSNSAYLTYLIDDLFPLLKQRQLTNRIDIFVEKGAFSVQEARKYLYAAKEAGFTLCLHADQFSRGGAALAAELNALSADHLEASQEEDFALLLQANTISIVLPGSSLGLGHPFARARKMLDAGLSVAIASDWNPGSAPMGNLAVQAALLGISEKLTLAETLAGVTLRAARALALHDRGILKAGMRADCAIFPCSDYREILYQQGSLAPKMIIAQGTVWEAMDATIRKVL